MKQLKSLTLFGLLLTFLGCQAPKELKTGEGFIEVKGGKIWYKVVGHGDKRPLVMLHGGPGYPSYYFNPLLLELSKERQVIVFDQLGCWRSDRISDTTLMTVENYVEQTRQLLNELNIKDYYLLGHSWGTMLGVDYYLKYSDGIKGLILGSPCLSSKMWVKDADALISTLPDSIQAVLRNNIKGVNQDSAKLNKAIKFY